MTEVRRHKATIARCFNVHKSVVAFSGHDSSNAICA